RVERWFLMQDYWPTWHFMFLYLFAVHFGKKFMANREPFSLRWPLIIYNAALVLLNFHIFWELFYCSYMRGYSYLCQHLDYSEDPYENAHCQGPVVVLLLQVYRVHGHYFSLYCARRNHLISFLHVYHHATMFPLWWIRSQVGGRRPDLCRRHDQLFCARVMYTYYGLCAVGESVQKYLWWKRYLTRMQLIQFFIGMPLAADWLRRGAHLDGVRAMFYGMSMIILFATSTTKNTCRGPTPTRSGRPSMATLANGSVMDEEHLVQDDSLRVDAGAADQNAETPRLPPSTGVREDGSIEVKHRHLLAGKSFPGACQLLVGTGDYQRVLDMAAAGKRGNIDTQVRDILADSPNSPVREKCRPQCRSSPFGQGLEDCRPEDVAQSLVSSFIINFMNVHEFARQEVVKFSKLFGASTGHKAALGGPLLASPSDGWTFSPLMKVADLGRSSATGPRRRQLAFQRNRAYCKFQLRLTFGQLR
uniref:Elongation of very long chain fatty acids protein n=1 Tax=Macrostomum lignano TaxID=282301 RepID=A0A1I8JP09_9PLAT